MSKLFLTGRQVEVLRLRGQGLTQEEVARSLNTSRENISIIEKRAHENARRAKATWDFLNKLKIGARVTIPRGTHLNDIHRVVLSKADEIDVKMKIDCIGIQEEVKSSARSSIKCRRVIKPITITILPDGTLTVG